MQWPGATEQDQRETARVDAAAHGDEPDRFGHRLVAYGQDALRRSRNIATHAAGQRPQGGARPLRVERDAAGEIAGVEQAEDKARIGHGRHGAAAAVAGWSRLGLGAFGSDLQGAGLVEPGDAAAARPDRVHIDHLDAQRKAADAALAGRHRRAVADHADIGAGAAHIERDQVAEPGPLAFDLAAQRARRRAGQAPR